MPSLRQLQYLVCLADLLNFSRAAERLHVTQPTLSTQIAQLEARLGLQLFERNRARVLLTPQGAGVVRRARDILRATEDLRDFAREGAADPSGGLLRLGVVPTLGAYLLSVAMPQIRTSLPGLRLAVREDSPTALLTQLSEGRHDALALPFVPQLPGLQVAPLLLEDFHLVLPARHPLAALTAVPPEALRGETMLSLAPGDAVFDQIVGLCAESGAELARDYEGTSLDTLRQMVATGMGVALLPALYIRSEVTREALVVTRPLTGRAPQRPVGLVWRQSHPAAERLQHLAQVVRGAVAGFGALPD